MSIPNRKHAENHLKANELKEWTIACQHCKRPLWKVTDILKYGTKVSAKKLAYCGVPEYNDIWSVDEKTCSQVNCPFCGEMWLKVIKAGGKFFPKPFILELDV